MTGFGDPADVDEPLCSWRTLSKVTQAHCEKAWNAELAQFE